jgi:hypothetical protein
MHWEYFYHLHLSSQSGFSMQEIFSKKLFNGIIISAIVDASWPETRKDTFLCGSFQEYLVDLKIGLNHSHGLAMYILLEPKSIAFHKYKNPLKWLDIALKGFTAIKDISIPVLGAEYFKK